MKKIQAVVFDWDKMVYHEPVFFSKYFSEKYHLLLEEVTKFFINEFSKCLIGQADIKKVLPKYLSKWDWKKGVDKFLAMWFEFGEIDLEMTKIIIKLKSQNFVCILATRNEKYRTNYIKKKYKLESLFDYIFSSCDVGFKKPDPKFYQAIVNKTKINPESIIIFDDRPEHIKVPEEMGFVSLLYKNKAQFKKDLAKFGIKI